MGVQVLFVTARAAAEVYRAELSPAVEYRCLHTGSTLRTLLPLTRLLRRLRPDAVLSTLVESNFLAIAAARLAQTEARVVIREANTLSQALLRNPRRIKRLTGRLIPYIYPKADAIVASSQGMQHDLIANFRIPPHKIRRIPNPLPLAWIRQHAQAPVQHPWFAAGQPPVILGVGRLERAKDFATLIRAFAKVRAEQEARLLILGEGSMRPQLETLVRELGLSECVALPGFDPNPFRYMARAKVFAMSSIYEGVSECVGAGVGVRLPRGQHRLPQRAVGNPKRRRIWTPRACRRCGRARGKYPESPSGGSALSTCRLDRAVRRIRGLSRLLGSAFWNEAGCIWTRDVP
jgi:glycosyltransferase involved in cell wall biosynthesis